VVGLYRVTVELGRSKCKVDVEVSDYVEVLDYARNRSKTRDYGPRACSVLSPVPVFACRSKKPDQTGLSNTIHHEGERHFSLDFQDFEMHDMLNEDM